MAKAPAEFDRWYVKSAYQEFVKAEGVPLYEGSAIENLATLSLGDWERRGGKAAYTRLGNQEERNLQIVEIPAKGQLKPERHMYDSVMYVMKGRGATTVWQEGEPRQTVEWEEGALLAIPLNAWHQEFNASNSEPCRVLFGTNMPYIINLFNNPEFVFNNPFSFTDRYSHAMQNFFAGEGKHWEHRMFETHFMPDIRTLALDANPVRGHRHLTIQLSMASTSIGMHVAEVHEGTYMTAHRHGAGAHVVAIQGEGYELLWMEGEEKSRRRIPLQPYAVIAPKHNEFHQHFNTGKGPFRMLAFRGYGSRYGWGRDYEIVSSTAQTTDRTAPAFNISYEMEDPEIRNGYYRELEKNGISSKLPPVHQRG